MIIDHSKLLGLTNRIVTAGGSSPTEAAIVAEHLVEANLRGHDSHGVGMLVAYVRDLDAGTLKINQTPEIVSDTGTISVWDARAGYGQVVARQAVEWAIEAAKKHGVAVNGLAQRAPYRPRRHLWRDRRARRHGGAAFRECRFGLAGVAPFRGREGRFLTNPVCIAIPGTDNNEPILLDFATSRVALGKVRVAHNAGKPMLDGALLDHAGEPTTDPSVMYTEPRGVVLPFGEHKGSGLALVCELSGRRHRRLAQRHHVDAARTRHHQRHAEHRDRPGATVDARQHDGRDRRHALLGEIGQARGSGPAGAGRR